MSLIVVKNDTLVFSNFVSKHNRLPSEIPLMSYIKNIITMGGFVIPVRFTDTCYLALTETSDLPLSKHKQFLTGPQFILICNFIISEHRFDNDIKNELSVLSKDGKDIVHHFVTASLNNFYCRSHKLELESAATAGHFIYDDAVKIYREAHKACDVNVFPFYEVSIKELSNFVNEFLEVFKKNEDTIKIRNYIDKKGYKIFIQHF